MICSFDDFLKIVERFDTVFFELDMDNYDENYNFIDWDIHNSLKQERIYDIVCSSISHNHSIYGNKHLIQNIADFIITDDDEGVFDQNSIIDEADVLYEIISDLLSDTELWMVELAAL